MKDIIEQQIVEAVWKLLLGRVNELLNEMEFSIPFIESGKCGDGPMVIPSVALASCERTEKERIIRVDTYSVTITFEIPETPESETHCYAYAVAVTEAVDKDKSLGGIADHVSITGKKYITPKKANCGENWGLNIILSITVEK